MITTIVHKYLDFKFREVERFIKKPLETQEKILDYLLRNGEKTLIGQQFGFDSIKTKDDFRKKVPIFHYEDLRPYLDKIIVEKKQNSLWNKPVE